MWDRRPEFHLHGVAECAKDAAAAFGTFPSLPRAAAKVRL
jgi:hypothetical protein